MNKLHVQITGLIQSFADGFFGDLVKHHPLHRNLGGQQLQQVPADAFPFAIFVRGQQQLIRTFKASLSSRTTFFLSFGTTYRGSKLASVLTPRLAHF